MRSSVRTGIREHRQSHRLQNIPHEHTSGRRDEQEPSTNAFDEHSCRKRPEEIPNLQEAVDQKLDGHCMSEVPRWDGSVYGYLRRGISDTQLVEDFGEVVRNKSTPV